MPPDGITRRGLFLFAGVSAPVELPAPAPDGVTYVVTKTAAALIGVAECTITRWRTAGYLSPVEGSPPRRPLYRWPDVVEAEYLARQAAIAASGTDAQVRRIRAA
jgi:hypothetical protein